MNNVLELKGKFEQKSRNGSYGGSRNMPSDKSVKIDKIQKLINELSILKKYWDEDNIVNKAFVSVHYCDVIAKSNRLSVLLCNGSKDSNDSVVGAKFTENTNEKKHIITHYISKKVIVESIRYLELVHKIMNEANVNEISHKNLEGKNVEKFQSFYNKHNLSKTKFQNIVVDSYYVESFRVPSNEFNNKNNSIITIYKTDINTIDLLDKIGIKITESKIIEETTLLLLPNELEILKNNAPYLISMAITDISEIPKYNFDEVENDIISIPNPKNEPVIGVIDTQFDERVYFSKWVEYTNMISSDIELIPNDYNHGTAIASILVDGANINPEYNDGCGRFRVRHFGVATSGKFSSFTVIKSIKDIISSNKDIKVWNLSLGSNLEINQNFISPEGALLDKIQTENDVIFVIAGTNNNSGKKNMLVGAPADSINSLVVNSVDINGKPANYSRVGPVLSFFQKPDISYYGGTNQNPMRVCTPNGEGFVTGTSFAAPWISRKMAYLINVLGFTRETAKAIIIHSATGWEKSEIDSMAMGYGVVPIKIEDIINSKDDEIQFILNGVSEEYNSYTYNLPVPMNEGEHPFIAKATMCYFPYCSRNQGVDYTNTEFDLYFGVVKDNKNINTINQNKQIDYTDNYTKEVEARKNFRKWDNVKYITEYYSNRKKPKKSNEAGVWGISVKTKERLKEKFGNGIRFGIVITLKELNGINRINEFEKLCLSRGWLVHRVDVKNKIDIYNVMEEDIEFNE